MKQLPRLLLAVLLFIAIPLAAVAQSTGTVSGRVTDRASGDPLSSVQVYIAGTTRGSLTNQQGQFVIAGVPAGSYELRATIIGYAQESQNITVTAGQSATADFQLRASAVELAAIITTATGQQQRTRELGNSVANITPANVPMATVNNVTTLLQSRSPGVTVTSASGTAGTASRIRIRGSNSVSLSNEPLIIVDGVRVNTSNTDLLSTGGQYASRLDDFNPEQIESIEVLKGPAASALYGTAAANGVIQITTRRGKSGPARWSLYTEQGSVKDVTEYPTSYTASSSSGGTGPGQRCVVYDLAMGNCSTIVGLQSYNPLEDPEQSPFRTGSRRQYGISVNGGGEEAQYYVAADFEDEQGTLKSSSITGRNPNQTDRLNLRANINARASETLDFAVRAGYSTGTLALPVNDNHLLGIYLNGMLGSGDPNVQSGLYGDFTFPQLLANVREQEVRRMTGALNVSFRPSNWLSFTGTTGIDQVNRHDGQFYPPNVLSTYTALYRDGFRDSYRVETMNITTTLNASGTFALNDNLVSTTTIGAQHNREEYHDTRASGEGMAPGVTSLQGASRLFVARENTAENATVGAFVQQQFAFRDRVYLTAAIRGDDNSAFGDRIGWVTYPAFSASWVVSEEPFFPDVPMLSSLRLRSAWGKSGLRPSFRDAITTYNPVSVRLEGAEVTGFTLAGTGSAELRPEIARELEIGFDAGILDDRIALELTHYNKLSRDALVRRTLAPSLGLSTNAFANIGSVSNKGFEAVLRGQIVKSENFGWDATLSASTTKNRLEKLADDIPFIAVSTGRNRQEHREGYALGGYWQRKISYNDVNGDGMIQYDRNTCNAPLTTSANCEVAIDSALSYLGQPFPEREAALSTTMTLFKLFRVSALIDHKGGFKQMNFSRFDRCSWEQLCDATYVREAATLRDQAAWIAYNIVEPNTNTMLYLEDGSFVKFRELSFSIDAPASLLERYGRGISTLRLTLSGRNLKTWTDYRGLDPEVNQNGLSNFSTQEYYTQPPLRYYTARIDLNF